MEGEPPVDDVPPPQHSLNRSTIIAFSVVAVLAIIAVVVAWVINAYSIGLSPLRSPIPWLGGSPTGLLYFLLFPVTPFVIFHLAADRMNFKNHLRVLATALFFGGAIGTFVGSVIGQYVFTAINPSFGVDITGLFFIFPYFQEGVYAFFAGLSGIALRNLTN